MSAHSPRSQEIDIETGITPAVKDLRSLFEQKANTFPPNHTASRRPGDKSPLLSPRQSPGRRPSPTPSNDTVPLNSPPPDQSSLRKRPPPPPPSRGLKQQIVSPSSSTPPLLHATSDKGSVAENRSPSSIKQRLAARNPPPLPDLRLDQTEIIDASAEADGTADERSSSQGSAVSLPLPLPLPQRPVQAHLPQISSYSNPFESDFGDTAPILPPRPSPKPHLPRRPGRASYPPNPNGHQSEPEVGGQTVPTNALALAPSPSRQRPIAYAAQKGSRSSPSSSNAASASNLSRVPSGSDGGGPPPPMPPRSFSSKVPAVTDEPLTESPVSSFAGPLPPPLPLRRPPTPSHPPTIRKVSAPTNSHLPQPPSLIPPTRHTPPIVHPHESAVHLPPPTHSHRPVVPTRQLTRDSDDADANSRASEAIDVDDVERGSTYTMRSVPTSQRNGATIGKLPPPPTRMIAPGDKLPAVRPSISSDEESEESAEEEDSKSKFLHAMPDTSCSSRRSPVLRCHKYDSVQVQTQTHSATICAAGHVYVAATGHHVRVYDLSLSESPILVLDGKAVGLKELKATSLEFCPAKAAQNKGRYVWIGTKDGHMLELDVTTGQLTGTRLSVHLSSITRILRHDDAMLSVDDTGKVTIWTPGATGEDLRLASAAGRNTRITESHGFAGIFGGKLWTSAREATAPGTRGPSVRVYDIWTPGSPTRSVLPTEQVGTVTSGTILPSDPDHVYLGHEGGFVTVWLLTTDDGLPVCEEAMRISNSDVLCLVGINNRLWVGGRNGTIAAYSVDSRPWVMTNNWVAHWNSQSPLPLQKIAVDPYSIDKIGRLCVYSVGRDDNVKTWDGFLGADWQDAELLKIEKNFSHFRDITMLFISWNIGACKPEQLSGSNENSSFLYEALNSVDSPDIIVFGLQEVVPLDKANVAKFVKKKKGLEGASSTLHAEHRRWADKLVGAVAFALPNHRYKLLYSKELVGLLSCVLVKDKELATTRDCAAHTISRGVGGRFGNKGAVAVRLLMDDTSLCFLNCHLAAGHRRVRDRNADAAAIIEHERLFPEPETLGETSAFVGGGDGTMALDHEIVFMSGDLNYRIDHRRDVVVSSVQQNTYQGLLIHDQLTKEMKTNIRLHTFMEGPITFPPTYKYDLHSTEYDTSEKRRIPAWCDRVLWRVRDPTRVEQLHYKRYEADVSDHRPISAAFRVSIKSIQPETRNRVKEQVQSQWSVRERQLLDDAREFYTRQLVL